MKNFLKNNIFLLIIVTIALVLRLYQLGSVPISPDWDEAALGYNAYSVLHTGKDEYGKFLPIIFRSFDDYKPGLYIYLIIPFIKLFGLSVFSVRLPAALIGVAAVIGTYFLLLQFFANHNHKKKIALLASFLLAISPWHIQFTHAAFEASVGMCCNLYAILFFLKGLKNNRLFFLSILFAVLSMYVYQSEKVFVPLLGLLLLNIYWEKVVSMSRKKIAAIIILGVLLLLPLLVYTITNQSAFARARGVSVFSDTVQLLHAPAQRLLVDATNHDKIGLFLDNRRFIFMKTVVANYLSHFDLNWLFITGDIARHHAPGMGLLYIWELPFLLLGIYSVFFSPLEKKIKLLIFGWLLLVPIPASITSGVPHAIRTLNFLPLPQIFVSVGLMMVYQKISNVKIKYVIIFPFFLFFIFNFLYYLDQYYVQQNYFNAIDWQYGYAKMVPFVKQEEKKYDHVIITNQPFMDQSYIFFLFYLQYNPATYQQESMRASGGFRETHQFGKFVFRPIDWTKEEKNKRTLYIGRADDFPATIKRQFQVNFPDGKPAMVAVEGNE